MRIPCRTTPQFWLVYRVLPPEVKAIARKNYRLWTANALHPSLHFKQITKPNWSIRIGNHYRAVGRFDGSVFVWEWIGSHAEYDKNYR